MAPLPAKFFTVEQAGEYLIVPTGTVLRWIKEGKLPAYKVGKLWRIAEEDLEAFLASGYKGTTPESPDE